VERQNLAYIYAISAVLLWSTVASAFKISLRHLDVWQLLFISSLAACICLLCILIFQKKQSLLFELSRNNLIRLLGFGILNPFCYYLILLKAYALLPAQVALALNYTWAITLMLLSIPILKHKVNRFDLLATVICYSGVVIICFASNRPGAASLSYTGVALALLSTLVWALYWLCKTKDRIDAVAGLFVSFVFSVPFITVSCFVFSDFSSINTMGILGGIYLGFFEMGFSFVLWLLALQHTSSAAKISTFIFMSPFLSLFMIQYIVGESIANTTVYGLVLIICGLFIQHKWQGAS
jgi:drug/metabolite transporter (DMT)-like permease